GRAPPSLRLRVLPQRAGGGHPRRGAVRPRRRLRRPQGHELHRPRALPRDLRRLRGQRPPRRQRPARGGGLGAGLSPHDQRHHPPPGHRLRRSDRGDHHRQLRPGPGADRRVRRDGAQLRRGAVRQHPRGRHQRRRRRGGRARARRGGRRRTLPGAAVHDLRPRRGRGLGHQHRTHGRAPHARAGRCHPHHDAGARRHPGGGHARHPGDGGPHGHRLLRPHAVAGHGDRCAVRLRRDEPELPPRRPVRSDDRPRRCRAVRDHVRGHRRQRAPPGGGPRQPRAPPGERPCRDTCRL
ncbi:MAG: Mn-Zn_transporter_SitD, partial [uncultured Acidimicrobiales bacterium]